MASGSGENQDDTETKEPVDLLRQREESNAAAAAAAATESPPPPLASESEVTEYEVHGPPEAGDRNPSAADATELPPFALQSEITEDEVHGPPETGGRNPSDATATATAAAGEQKGKEAVSLFWSAWGSAGGKPPLPSGSKPPLPPGGKPPLPSGSKPPLPPSGKPPLKDVFDELMLEGKRERGGETDQKDEAEGTPKQQDEQAKALALWPKKGKEPLWRKKVHITELIRHYNLLEMVAGRGVEFHSYALNLCNAYSAFRPVHGDGECFYRSFIFSYLEQVLDRQNTHEEHRVLAAVKGVARQHARLGWASEFSRSHKAFKKLINRVMRWKTQRRWKHTPTVNSYPIEKLLEFFNDDKRTVDIFTFLRLVAAIWICSHSEEFVPLIPELNEGYTLTEWCFQEAIPRKVFTDHIQITALVRALQVPLRVEYLFQEAGQDLYIGQDSQDDMPRSMCWPRHHHQVPPDHEVPRVTVLYMQEHYDIIYPYHSDAPVISGERGESTAAITELLPLAPQFEIIKEEVHGPPKARIWIPSTTTATAAERKGEETMSLFNELMLERQRSRKAEQKDEAEGMPRQQNEQMKETAVWPKEGKKALWRKFPTRRNVMIVVLLIVSLLMLLPAKTESFQHFDSIEGAAQRLAGLDNLGDLRLQLEEERPVPGVGFDFFLHPIMIAIYSFLFMGLITWFIGPKEEH